MYTVKNSAIKYSYTDDIRNGMTLLTLEIEISMD